MSRIYRCPEPSLDPPDDRPEIPPRDEDKIYEEMRDRKLWEKYQESQPST